MVNPVDAFPQTLTINDRIVPVEIVNTESVFEADLVSVLSLISRGEITVKPRNRRLTPVAVSRISHVLTPGHLGTVLAAVSPEQHPEFDPVTIRPETWYLLLKSAGYIRFDGSQVNLTQTGKKILNRPMVELSGELWRKWLNAGSINELRRVDVLRGQTSMKRPLAIAAPRRHLIASALALLPPAKWVTVREFYESIQASEYAFNIARYPRGLYFLRRDFGMLSNTPDTVDLLNETFLRILIMEFAAATGVADLALIPPWGTRDLSGFFGISHWDCLSPYDALSGFRLTERGSAILQNRSHRVANEPEFSPLIVQANFDIHSAGSSISPADRAYLSRIATNTTDSTWHITERSVLDAVEQGETPGNILEFLKIRAREDLPDPVVSLFDDIDRRLSRIRDQGLVRLITVSDPAVKLQIIHHPRLRKLCIDTGGEYLAVHARHEKSFRKELKAMGWIIGR